MGRKLKVRERQRTAALAFVNEHPGALAREIATAMSGELEGWCKKLQMMCFLGELKREPVTVDSTASPNRRRVVRTFRYWALRDEILDSESVDELMATIEVETVPQVKEKPPWVTRNTDPNRRPIQNQSGGQLQGYGPRGFSAITQLD